MGRITNATIDVICACLLFMILFSACSKNTQTNYYEKEKEYAIASWELEQGCTARPVASYVAQKKYQYGIKQPQVKIDSNIVVTTKPFPQVKKSQVYMTKDSAVISASPSYVHEIEQSATQPSAELSVLKWFRLLAFLPIGLAVVLMQRMRTKRSKQKERDTLIFGGLISLLIVILLIVLIISLV